MDIVRTQPITGPAAWRGPDFDGDTRWIHHLKPDHIALFDTLEEVRAWLAKVTGGKVAA